MQVCGFDPDDMDIHEVEDLLGVLDYLGFKALGSKAICRTTALGEQSVGSTYIA